MAARQKKAAFKHSHIVLSVANADTAAHDFAQISDIDNNLMCVVRNWVKATPRSRGRWGSHFKKDKFNTANIKTGAFAPQGRDVGHNELILTSVEVDTTGNVTKRKPITYRSSVIEVRA